MNAEREGTSWRQLEKIVSTDEAAKMLGIAKRTLQRQGEYGPRRINVSPGRFGYRVEDLLRWRREQESAGRSFSGEDIDYVSANSGVVFRGAVYAWGEWGFGSTLYAHRRLAVCGGEDGGPAKTVTLHLGPASSYGIYEAVIFDRDGLAAEAPITIVPAEGETIGGQAKWFISSPFGLVRLIPFVFEHDGVGDCWAVG